MKKLEKAMFQIEKQKKYEIFSKFHIFLLKVYGLFLKIRIFVDQLRNFFEFQIGSKLYYNT